MSRSFQIRNFKNSILTLDMLNLKLNSLIEENFNLNLDLKVLSNDSEYKSNMPMDICNKNFYLKNFKVYIYYQEGIFNVTSRAICGIERVLYIGVVITLADILKGEISSNDGAWHNSDIYTSTKLWKEFLKIYNDSKNLMDKFYHLEINSKLLDTLNLYQITDLIFQLCNINYIHQFKNEDNHYLNDTYNLKFLKDISNIFKFAKSKFENNSDFLAIFGYLLFNKEYSFIEYDQFGEYIEDLSLEYLKKSVKLKNPLGIAIHNKVCYNEKANKIQLHYLDNIPLSISKIELKDYLT
ncbi:MAG: hypothetical protein ACI4WH_01135 [Oscillospiraceae bacterium]